MAFLTGLTGGGAGTTKPSGFLGGVRQRTAQESPAQAQHDATQEDIAAKAAAQEQKDNTLFGSRTLGAIRNGAKAVVDPIVGALATPVLRADQALVAGYGKLTGNEGLAGRAYDPLPLPSPLGGRPINVTPQKAFGEGGGKQVVGDTLKYAATVYPGTTAEKAVGDVFLGQLSKAAAEGATGGAISGAAYGAGEGLADDNSYESAAKKAAIYGGGGLVLGGLLGAGGAKLAQPAAERAAAEFEATRLRPLPVQDASTPADVNVRRFQPLPVEDQNVRPGATRANARQVPITRAPEPYVPEGELPVINMGPKGRDTLPVIDAAPRKSARPAANGDVSFVPVKEAAPAEPRPAPRTVPVVTKPAQVKRSPAEATTIPKGRPVTVDVPKNVATVPVRAPKAGQASTISKAAQDVNRKLVEQGLHSIPDDELARIASISKGDQVGRAASLLEDFPRALRMATRQEPMADGVAPQVLYNAVKNKAAADGNGEALSALARSPIAAERAQAAQTLGSAGFNNDPVDPVQAIRDIENTRAAAAERRRQPSDVKKEVATAKTFIKKASAKETWNSVIDGLTC